jgi:(E)-4-hydroxy-3-methylbut-2-enyl-diphosphate synthase
MAVPTFDAVKTIYKLKDAGVKSALVADIHFDYRLALEAAEAGIDKIRINPGNIGENAKIKAVADKCTALDIPIRIGVNSGSVDKKILAKYGTATAEALAESALENIALLEQYDFNNIIVAVKSSDVRKMIQANRIVAERCSYPMHIGVTEAGSDKSGSIKGAVGIGALLADGIGDTIRVSLTADPTTEIARGREILSSLGLDVKNLVNIVSCPTCGRTKVDMMGTVAELERRVGEIKVSRPITVAVMGCAVNGPGEARDADVGVACGNGEGLLFVRGEILHKVPESELLPALLRQIEEMTGEKL